MGRRNRRARNPLGRIRDPGIVREWLEIYEEAERIFAGVLPEVKKDISERHGRFSEDAVLAVLRIAERQGLIWDLGKTEPFSPEDRAGIDIFFTDAYGRQKLQVKSSRSAAYEFHKKSRGRIPVMWVGKARPEKIAKELAVRFPSLRRLPRLLQ